ncbi:Pecanex-like protein 4 [Symbiodinium microadriaticum]|uniref:Pecanex-like protein 4 n=1 Tax=Symbiodinium microadriaticum TaxID=2951 RepID=A0A1Q9F0G0_SYMMI|nr:Pecanex-like protein 4 [Symbiodinium microadriaticum]
MAILAQVGVLEEEVGVPEKEEFPSLMRAFVQMRVADARQAYTQALFKGVDGIAVEVFLVAALVLRQARIIMSQTPRAAVDIWLAGLLHLASPAWPLYALVFAVSVLRQRALLLLSHLRYALHLCRVTASVPKLRHPVTGPLLWINALLFPGLLLVVAIATVLEAPLITIFTLPLFAVGGPRPRHGHIDGAPVEKGLEGLFYSRWGWGMIYRSPSPLTSTVTSLCVPV